MYSTDEVQDDEDDLKEGNMISLYYSTRLISTKSGTNVKEIQKLIIGII